MPSPNQVFTFNGAQVRLQGPHAHDNNVWIAHEVTSNRQVYISAEWLVANQPSSLSPEVITRVTAEINDSVVITPGAAIPVVHAATGEIEEISADDRPVRRRRARRPVCPACDESYTGSLGNDHACADVARVSCKRCRSFNPLHLETPPRPPYLCPTCVTAGVFVCKSCAQPQATRGRYGDICDACNPLPAVNIWSALGMRAQGNEMTIETKSHRPFAVEVESFLMPGDAVSPRVRVPGGWNEGPDGSIHGDPGSSEAIEFKSPPLRGDGGLHLLRDGVKKIRDMGFRANKSCGLHCHVDMISSSPAEREAVFKFGTWIQDDVYKLVARSRSSATYCKKLTTSMNSAERYSWMNMKHAYDRHRTVEFRLHHGTTQPDRIVEWVKVCLRIVEVGLKLGHMRTRPAGSMFNLLGFNAYEREYWMDVARSLHGAEVTFTNGGTPE